MDRVDRTGSDEVARAPALQGWSLPHLTWDLAMEDLPMSSVSTVLEGTATQHLKRWLGLAQSADTAHLFLPEKTGLALPSTALLKRTKTANLLNIEEQSVTR